MKIGLFITNQHTLDTDMVSALEEQLALIRHVRDRGWSSCVSSMHYLNEGASQKLQPVPTLARFAADAGEMTLGIAIMLLSLQNPVHVAETIATLDIITRGNFIFGVGLGYREVEFDAFGVAKGTRLARFEENLDVIKRLWNGEEVSYESATCKLDKVRMNLRPVQKPHPPIWIAANNDNAVRRAARLGDTWIINPHGTMETLRRQMVLYRDELDKVGKPFPAEFPCVREIFCARSRQQALDMAGPYLAEMYKGYVKWGQDKAMPGDDPLDMPFEELIKDRFVLGSPEECYEQLRPCWEEHGVNHFLFRTHWAGMPFSSTLASTRLISDELMPELLKL